MTMRDENCIFCKIAAGEIPSATLYEDDDFRVILDAGPASKGHALILPKEHYANLYELDDELAAKVMHEAVVKAGCRITTGNLNTRYVMDMLTEYGYVDTAWKLMTREEDF